MFLQEWLMRKSMEEEGFDPARFQIKVNHVHGRNTVNGHDFGLKYPKSYLQKIKDLPSQKTVNYAFSGFISEQGGRRAMLEPFMNEGNIVENSRHGRSKKTKYGFNPKYYALLKSSYYTLCPHQKDWKWDTDTRWTYRFIEACFTHSMPVLFKEAPCGEAFIQGFHFVWSSEAFNLENFDEKVEENYERAVSLWTLSESDIRTLAAMQL